MEDKHKRKFKELEESDTTYNEQEIKFDSYDGAQMVNNAKKRSTFFLLAPRHLKKEVFLRLDRLQRGILTWMQQSGEEEPVNFPLTLREIYKSKYGLATKGNSKNVRFTIFMMGNGLHPN